MVQWEKEKKVVRFNCYYHQRSNKNVQRVKMYVYVCALRMYACLRCVFILTVVVGENDLRNNII